MIIIDVERDGNERETRGFRGRAGVWDLHELDCCGTTWRRLRGIWLFHGGGRGTTSQGIVISPVMEALLPWAQQAPGWVRLTGVGGDDGIYGTSTGG